MRDEDALARGSHPRRPARNELDALTTGRQTRWTVDVCSLMRAVARLSGGGKTGKGRRGERRCQPERAQHSYVHRDIPTDRRSNQSRALRWTARTRPARAASQSPELFEQASHRPAHTLSIRHLIGGAVNKAGWRPAGLNNGLCCDHFPRRLSRRASVRGSGFIRRDGLR